MRQPRRRAKNGTRGQAVRVKTARGRKTSSTRWLQRQLNDPYVADAKRAGYRSRSAWKLCQLDDQRKFLKQGARILDLGAAPGGWTQVAAERCGKSSTIVAVDVLSMEPVNGATVINLDMADPESMEVISAQIGGKVDVILSDMAAPTTGHRQTDHIRTMALCEIAVEVARQHLIKGGVLVVKVFQGGAERDLLNDLKKSFDNVRHVKPPASRKESPETYLVAEGYRG
ncbi:MAG: rRNA methyltransferase [Rhodospirillaceae bacterium]|nr:rRNA methyltransferase [Rhodospirillaceae bacterium]|tara:strand:- start:3791 stop:4474 length:684 start_codon:yes stop_codon:yes gene_type:complete